MVVVAGVVVVARDAQPFPPRLVRVTRRHGRVIPLRRPLPGDCVKEPLVPADRDGEPVEPDGPLDAAQHQVMARPDHIDPGRQNAVVRTADTTAPAGQELADLLGQPRALGRAGRGRAALGGAEELGSQQFLIGDMSERHSGATEPSGTRGARHPGRAEQRHQPEPAQTGTATLKHCEAQLVDQLDQSECGHATQERQPEEIHHPGQQLRFCDLCDVPPQQVIEMTRLAAGRRHRPYRRSTA
jgi:hypothetical protein